MYLFIDTTKDITVGLLGDDYEWVEYEYFENAKGSAIIHKCIYDQLEKQNKKINDVKGLVQIAGPGSYTGMRVSEGIAQIFNWQQFKTYSFYHYEVPRLLGSEQGTWFANAFKGEYFLFSWKKEEESILLIKKEEFDINTIKNLYTSFLFDDFERDILLTSKLIYKNGKSLFKKIIDENVHRPLYYYRTLDQEYTRK